jgi:hypothetical protein
MKRSSAIALLSIGMLALATTGCKSSHEGAMDPKMDAMVQQMLSKMGVPGENSKPNPVAKSLDCPAIQSVIKHVEAGHKPISASSLTGLNAWAAWCGLPSAKASGI